MIVERSILKYVFFYLKIEMCFTAIWKNSEISIFLKLIWHLSSLTFLNKIFSNQAHTRVENTHVFLYSIRICGKCSKFHNNLNLHVPWSKTNETRLRNTNIFGRQQRKFRSVFTWLLLASAVIEQVVVAVAANNSNKESHTLKLHSMYGVFITRTIKETFQVYS